MAPVDVSAMRGEELAGEAYRPFYQLRGVAATSVLPATHGIGFDLTVLRLEILAR